MSPNGIAFFALAALLPLGGVLFFMFRAPLATLLVFLFSFMFLPEETFFDLPGTPPIGKYELTAVVCLLGVLWRGRKALFEARPFRSIEILVVVMCIGNIGTALTNSDAIVHGPTVLPGLSAYEALSVSISDVLLYLLPFLLGRALFVNAGHLRQFLVGLAIAGLVYTPFMFVELMMSPQLHYWVYGFHQHEFIQTIRGGGYRPMAFMPHGLTLALFTGWSILAALTLFRARRPMPVVPSPVVGVLNFGFLVACKSLTAVLYVVALGPLIAFFKPRFIVRVCGLVAIIVLTYPLMRTTGLFPQTALVEAAKSTVGARAAQSLEFRFTMETLIADHASERPLFGWGRFRRNMLFDDYTGRDVSVADGHWIVEYSLRGAWGFVAIFSLLAAPLFYVWRRLKWVRGDDDRMMLAGLACIYAISLFDLLPNGLQASFTVFIGGVLWGTTRGLSRRQPREAPRTFSLNNPPLVEPGRSR